jgi:hypothetical protein
MSSCWKTRSRRITHKVTDPPCFLNVESSTFCSGHSPENQLKHKAAVNLVAARDFTQKELLLPSFSSNELITFPAAKPSIYKKKSASVSSETLRSSSRTCRSVCFCHSYHVHHDDVFAIIVAMSMSWACLQNCQTSSPTSTCAQRYI